MNSNESKYTGIVINPISILKSVIEQHAKLLLKTIVGAPLLFFVGIMVAFLLGTSLGLKIILAIPVSIFFTFFVIKYPKAFALLFFFLLFFIEEFPTDLVVNTRWDRSITLLYAKSLGIPGLFGIDIFLYGSLILLSGILLWGKKRIPFLQDKIFFYMLIMLIVILISAIMSLVFTPDTVTTGAYKTSDIGFDMKPEVAKLVPYFQFKNFLYLYITYAVIRELITTKKMLDIFFRVFFSGVFISILIGIQRLIFYRSKLSPSYPLFYDDSTLLTFILFSVFVVLALGKNLFTKKTALFQITLVLIIFAFIGLSFRRAIWMGTAITVVTVFFMVPGKLKFRLVMFSLLIGLVGAIIFLTMGYETKFIGGVNTSSMKSSAYYRLAILYNMIKMKHFTALGYGVTPLWNLKLIMGSFTFNFENVHNFYYWLILRTGIIGIITYGILVSTAIKELIFVINNAMEDWYKILAQTVLIGFGLLLLLGWFHPIYAMARFVVMWGILYGLTSILKEICDEDLLKVNI